MKLIYPIVEGHGEVSAVPVLLRRILHEKIKIFDCDVDRPYRISRSKISKFDTDLAKSIMFGAGRINDAGGQGGVIIIADADDDCPNNMQNRFADFCKDQNFTVQWLLF